MSFFCVGKTILPNCQGILPMLYKRKVLTENKFIVELPSRYSACSFVILEQAATGFFATLKNDNVAVPRRIPNT